jgi:RNA polymerase sigma factor (sigma-70 family)
MQHAPAVARPRGMHRPARLLRLASDERLVAFVRGGDEGAFEAIYDRHHRAILAFCRHMVGVREEAEDAVQHTFLAAYRDLVGSAKPIELKAWLFAIARNRCLSILRARREQVALDDAEPSTEGLAAVVERREDVRELLGDLARLPEEQRAALLLSELGALDHEGIASVLGCRREKVKALVFQARSSLAADREARAIPCEQIRMQLASASGSALRRGPLRRHVRDCPGCRAFQDETARQRKLLALALPVLPTAALKAASLGHGAATAAHAAPGAAGGLVVGGTAGTAATGAGGSLGGALGTLGSAGVAKVAVAVAATAAIAGGSAVTIRAVSASHRSTPAVTTPTTTHSATTPLGAGVPPVAGTTPPRSGSARGFLPQRAAGAGGNGAAARAFARTRAHGGSAGRAHRPAHTLPRDAPVVPAPHSQSGAKAPRVHTTPLPSSHPQHIAQPTAPHTSADGGTSTTDGTTAPQQSPRSLHASPSPDG